MSNEFGQIMQHGYIVDDIEKAALEWVERLGVGPFYTIESMSMDTYLYRGAPTNLEMSLAFAYWGDIQIELIRPLNTEDTLYSEALKSAPGKLNHVATVVSDLDRLLDERKLRDRVVQSATMPTGLKFVYLEEYLPGGLHLELIEAQESTLQAFSGMQQVARAWDGENPLRSMASLGEDLAALSES